MNDKYNLAIRVTRFRGKKLRGDLWLSSWTAINFCITTDYRKVATLGNLTNAEIQLRGITDCCELLKLPFEFKIIGWNR